MTFEEFLDLFPQVQSEKHPIQETETTWANYEADRNPRFVAPPLQERRKVSPGQTSVVLLSARGAVGKSTLGKEIARRKRAPFVNLAGRKVGSDAAIGFITKMFGVGDAHLAFAELAEGNLLLVVDALDETRLGSGEGNFDVFLEDLAALLKKSRPNPSVVLLARTETADWVEYFLQEVGVPVAHYLVDFFDEGAAQEFVVRYISERSKGKVDIESKSFVKARDELLSGIKAATSEGGNEGLVRSVLGYAPVLEAVSEYLLDEENRRNYHRLLQALQRDAREWELLLQVAEAIFSREQQKVTKQVEQRLGPAGGSGWSAWETLYSPEEQFKRLLAWRFKLQPPQLPADLPMNLREGYEKIVLSALEDHPFRGSVDGLHPLFGEYLYARLLTDESAAMSSVAKRAREVLSAGTYLPTRALARFVHALTIREGQARVSGRNFGFVYESLLSDYEKPRDVSLSLRSVRAGEEHHCWVNVGDRALHFKVTDTMSGIWFWRRLSYASASVTCDVELGFSGGEFRLGPGVDVECSSVLCVSELRIYLADDNDGDEVVLVARTFQEMARAPIVRGRRFYVQGDLVPWPWSEYREREVQPLQVTPEIVEAYNHLARILLWFQASGHEEIARVNDLIENAATGGTTRAKDLLSFCIEKDLIRRGKLYSLNDGQLARHGIHYVDLKRRILREPIIKLLAEFLAR